MSNGSDYVEAAKAIQTIVASLDDEVKQQALHDQLMKLHSAYNAQIASATESISQLNADLDEMTKLLQKNNQRRRGMSLRQVLSGFVRL